MKSLETIVHSLMPRNKYDRFLLLARDIYGWEFSTFSRCHCFLSKSMNKLHEMSLSYLCRPENWLAVQLHMSIFINDGKKFLINCFMKSSFW